MFWPSGQGIRTHCGGRGRNLRELIVIRLQRCLVSGSPCFKSLLGGAPRPSQVPGVGAAARTDVIRIAPVRNCVTPVLAAELARGNHVQGAGWGP
jgi:hypothetical protein